MPCRLRVTRLAEALGDPDGCHAAAEARRPLSGEVELTASKKRGGSCTLRGEPMGNRPSQQGGFFDGYQRRAESGGVDGQG